MNETNITKICFLIVLIGLIFFIVFYEEEYSQKTISEMQIIGTKGIVVGRVDFVINEEPLIFILQNEEKIKVFYPKKMILEKNDIVEVYAETTEYNKEIELFAQRVRVK
jgi:Gpi18-like mannosyltransferase